MYNFVVTVIFKAIPCVGEWVWGPATTASICIMRVASSGAGYKSRGDSGCLC